MISTIASIKKRPHPDMLSHASVGTVAELAERIAKLASLSEFDLRSSHLETLLLSKEDMTMWDFVTEIPPGEGGNHPAHDGELAKCDRCGVDFEVQPNPPSEQCTFHWGRLYPTKVNGRPVIPS